VEGRAASIAASGARPDRQGRSQHACEIIDVIAQLDEGDEIDWR